MEMITEVMKIILEVGIEVQCEGLFQTEWLTELTCDELDMWFESPHIEPRPELVSPDRNQQESGCISNDSSVVCYLLKKCNIEPIRLIWVFKWFSVLLDP